MKKWLLTLLLAVGFGVPSCIPDCPEVMPFWDISDLSVEIRDKDFNTYLSGDEYVDDTLFFDLSFDYEYLSSQRFSFLNSAFALEKCEESGYGGSKDPMVAFTVISDQGFNQMDAGESLNDLVRVYPLPTYSVEELLSDFNESYSPHSVTFFLPLKPTQPDLRYFTVEFTLQSGRKLSKTTPSIFWK